MYPTTFGNEEETGLKLDDDDDDSICHNTILKKLK